MPTLAFSDLKTTAASGTLTSASFTPQAGDIIVVKITTEGVTGASYNTPTGGGWTYTSRVNDVTNSFCSNQIWTAPVTAGGTAQTVASTPSGTPGHASMMVEVWRGGQLAATPAICDARGSGAPSTPLTTVAAGSVVSWSNADFAANDPTGHTYRTTSGTPTEDGIDNQSPSFYVGYYAWQPAATAGAQTLGLTAPSTQTWTLAGIEIQDAGGVSPAAIPHGGRYWRENRKWRKRLTPVIDTAVSSAPVPVTVADAAAGISEDGALAVTATVPLPEAGGAAEALSAAVTEAGSDAAGAVEGLAVAVTVPLAEVAGAAESQAIALALADAAGAADTLSVTVAATLADAGAAVDIQAITAAVPLAEAAGATDSPVIAATVPLADPGAAADAITEAVTLGLADVAAAAESQVSGQPVTLADAAGATEAAAVAAAVPLPDAGAAAEALAVTVTLALADKGAAAESQVSGQPVSLADVAGAAELLSATVAAALPEVAAAADAIGLAVATGLADAAGAADALSVSITSAVPEGDVAAARDAISVAVSVPLTDFAGAADRMTLGAAVGFLEAAAAADAVVIITGIHPSGTVTWVARPEEPRWEAEPAGPRWEADAAPGRWSASPGTARWSTQPELARWRIMMAVFDPISSDSLEEVNVRWTSDLDGTVLDPTVSPLTVQMAFPVSSGNPLQPAHAVTWLAASWLSGGTGKGFIAQCLVGPGGGAVTLAAGKYDVWSWVQGTPESPKKFAGVLTVY